MNIKGKDIFLIIYSSFVSFLLTSLLALLINQWNYTFIPADNLSSNYRDIVVNESENKDVSTLICQINSKTNAFRIQKQCGKGYTPIYIKNSMLGLNLIEGREFTEEDFFLNSNVAIISEDCKENTYEEDGGTYISIDNSIYEVIGIFVKGSRGINENSNIFISMLSENYMFSGDRISGRYFFDSEEKTENSIFEGLGITLNKTVYELNTKERISLVKDTMFISYKILLLGVIFLLLSGLFIFVMWISAKKKIIIVNYICGGTEKNIFRDLYIKWLGISAFGGIISLLFALYVLDSKFYLSVFILELIMYALICRIILNVVVRKIINKMR